jgi:hypothetical protein
VSGFDMTWTCRRDLQIDGWKRIDRQIDRRDSYRVRSGYPFHPHCQITSMLESCRMYSDSTSAMALLFQRKEEKQDVERGKRGKKQLLYKGRALFPPPLSHRSRDIRQTTSMPLKCKWQRGPQKAATEDPHLLASLATQRLCLPASQTDKQMPPRPFLLMFTNLHKPPVFLLTNALPHLRSAHALQSAGKLGVLLLDLELCASRLGV